MGVVSAQVSNSTNFARCRSSLAGSLDLTTRFRVPKAHLGESLVVRVYRPLVHNAAENFRQAVQRCQPEQHAHFTTSWKLFP